MTPGRCAHSLRTTLAFVAGTVGGVLALAGCGTEPTLEPSDLPDPAEYAQALFDGANEERTDAGLAPLEWSECLVEPALERADAAADSDTLTHEILALDCADGARAGENLSRSDESAASIVGQWMDSAGHEANILDEAFDVGAVGCVLSEEQMTCSWLAHAERAPSGDESDNS